jgi:hypothetical protein
VPVVTTQPGTGSRTRARVWRLAADGGGRDGADNSPAFHGRPKAKNDACVRQRKVKMFKKRKDGGKRLLGTDVTSKKGKWKVIVNPLKNGDYYAVAKKKKEGTAGTIYVCEKDRSLTAHIKPSPD